MCTCRYIPNPLLLEGKKFDVRTYMLIACTNPFIVLFHTGYLRLACDEYDADSTDLHRHLTNQVTTYFLGLLNFIFFFLGGGGGREGRINKSNVVVGV